MQDYDYENGLVFLGDIISEAFHIANPAGNDAEEYENETFLFKSFCWGCNICKQGEDNCRPNFIYKPTGFSISWYKYVGRGMEIHGATSKKQWLKIVLDCINSMGIK